jgi:Na+-transporting NADH:ubiquinone oxidoreductase subunit NqrF
MKEEFNKNIEVVKTRQSIRAWRQRHYNKKYQINIYTHIYLYTLIYIYIHIKEWRNTNWMCKNCATPWKELHMDIEEGKEVS